MNPNELPITFQDFDSDQDEDDDENYLREIHQREFFMVNHFLKECEKFFEKYDPLFENLMPQHGDYDKIMFHLLNKAEEELTSEESSLLENYHKIKQIMQDGEDMVEHHFNLDDAEPEGEPPIPYWMKRNPILHKAAYDGMIKLNKNLIDIRDTIFVPTAPLEARKSIIDEKLKEMEGQPIHKIIQESQKEVDKRDARDWQALSPEQQTEEYVKKSRALGEVLNRISDDVQEDFDKRLRIIDMEQEELREFGILLFSYQYSSTLK